MKACEYRFFFFFSSRIRHTILQGDWSSDVCSSDLENCPAQVRNRHASIRARQDKGNFLDRKSVVKGKSVDHGGRRINKKKKKRKKKKERKKKKKKNNKPKKKIKQEKK